MSTDNKTTEKGKVTPFKYKNNFTLKNIEHRLGGLPGNNLFVIFLLVFSLFNIVKFDNDGCESSEKDTAS